MELGHAAVLSETNSGGFVVLCECSWIGTVHGMYRPGDAPSLRKRDRRLRAQDAATAEHRAHCDEIGRQIEREHAVALDNHAAYLSVVAPTVRRIGRWGAG